MSRLASIRLASLSTLALLAMLTLGACANSPTAPRQDQPVVGDSSAASRGELIRFGWRRP